MFANLRLVRGADSFFTQEIVPLLQQVADRFHWPAWSSFVVLDHVLRKNHARMLFKHSGKRTAYIHAEKNEKNFEVEQDLPTVSAVRMRPIARECGGNARSLGQNGPETATRQTLWRGKRH
jgi:hypothetical protein